MILSISKVVTVREQQERHLVQKRSEHTYPAQA